jgi:hypothetical protein
MLLNVAAHNVSIQNVKMSKREQYITYSVTKRTVSQNVKCIHFVMLYVMELLRCVQLRFVTLRHVTITLCRFT